MHASDLLGLGYPHQHARSGYYTALVKDSIGVSIFLSSAYTGVGFFEWDTYPTCVDIASTHDIQLEQAHQTMPYLTGPGRDQIDLLTIRCMINEGIAQLEQPKCQT